MKLSELETLVRRLRKDAQANKIRNPDVSFYPETNLDLHRAIADRAPFPRLDIPINTRDTPVGNYRVICSPSVPAEWARNGDYSIPIVYTPERPE